MGVVRNTPSANIKSLGFFYLAKALKANSLLEIYVDQPITVMQSLDASELEANAKLAGFVDIQQHEIEYFVREKDKDVKLRTIKISMIRPEKVNENEGKK